MANATAPTAAQTGARPTSQPRGWRQWLFRGLAATLVPALLLCFLEGALRWCGYGYPTHFFVRTEVDGQQLEADNPFFGRQFFPRGMASNPHGCVLATPKPSGTYRIFVLGESAAIGFPDPSVSFSRILEVMLRESYPATRFEVINTGMTAINSHVVLPIARDCAAQEPDLFVVYMGNNEVVGPFGTAGVLGPFSPNLELIRASIGAKQMRTGQLLSDVLRLLTPSGASPRSWHGMATFAQSLVRADDPRLENIYAHFRRNLEDICDVGAGARVLVCTVGTNLHDCAPFASVRRDDMPADQAAAWQTNYDEGVRLEEAGQYANASACYQRAADLDDTSANLHFRLGQMAAALGKPTDAHRHFVQARDLDALRFRADSRINEAIRAVAASRENRGVSLADVAAVFDQASADGCAGEELFYEHVHLNFEGNYVLARTVFEQIARFLPDARRSEDIAAAPASRNVCMARLAYGDWKRYQALGKIYDIMRQPPFTNQLDCTARNRRCGLQLEALKRRLDSGGYQDSTAALRRALVAADGDFDLHRDLAAILLKQGKFVECAEQYRKVLKYLPHQIEGYLGLAWVLGAQGKFAEALPFCDVAARMDPDQAEPENTKGQLLLDMGKLDQAILAFQRAVAISPADHKLYDQLGHAYVANAQPQQAITAFTSSLSLMPDNPETIGALQKLRPK